MSLSVAFNGGLSRPILPIRTHRWHIVHSKHIQSKRAISRLRRPTPTSAVACSQLVKPTSWIDFPTLSGFYILVGYHYGNSHCPIVWPLTVLTTSSGAGSLPLHTRLPKITVVTIPNELVVLFWKSALPVT